MDLKENDSKRNSMANAVLSVSSKKSSQLSISSNGSNVSGLSEQMRRPFGVAAIDLTPIIRKPEDFKNNLDLPFILCEKENLDNTLRKFIGKDIGKVESKLAVSVELLHGDIKQVSPFIFFSSEEEIKMRKDFYNLKDTIIIHTNGTCQYQFQRTTNYCDKSLILPVMLYSRTLFSAGNIRLQTIIYTVLLL